MTRLLSHQKSVSVIVTNTANNKTKICQDVKSYFRLHDQTLTNQRLFCSQKYINKTIQQ